MQRLLNGIARLFTRSTDSTSSSLTRLPSAGSLRDSEKSTSTTSIGTCIPLRYTRSSYGEMPPHNEDFPPKTVIVYTDGSCVSHRASGIGIFFGEGHPLNLSKALDVTEHNSGLAEIIAAQTALRRLIAWDEYRNEFVILRTDYLALITAMRLQGNRCFANEYDELRRIAAVFPHGVEFQHVKAHAGDPGNEKADELARKSVTWALPSARRSRSVTRSRSRSRSSSVSKSRKRSRSNHGRFETRDPKQNLDIAQGYDSGYESDTGSLDGKGGYYEKQAAMPRTAYVPHME